MRFKSYFLVVIVGLAVAVISFMATSAFAGSNRHPKASPLLEDIKLLEEKFDGWHYTAYRTDKQITLEIDVEDTSPVGLLAFRAANEQIVRDLVKQQEVLDVSIVLKQPLSLAAFTALVEKYKLNVNDTQVGIVDGNGKWGTLFTMPRHGELVPEVMLKAALETAQAESKTATAELRGVITVNGKLPSSLYDALATEQAVFLVDVTPSFVQDRMKQKHASLVQTDDVIVTSPHPIYWYLENHWEGQP